MGVPEAVSFPDDAIPIDVDPGDVPAPDTGLLAQAFHPAYIDVVLGTEFDDDTCDFVYHVTSSAAARRGIGESAAFWAAYVMGAYEGPDWTDCDPNDEGFVGWAMTSDTEPEYTFVFHETLRDGHNDGAFPNWAGGVYTREHHEQQTVVHEIGHQFGLAPLGAHPPDGYSIMSVPQHNPVVLRPDTFAEDELLDIRQTVSV